MIDGKPVDGGAPLVDVLPPGADAQTPARVELLCPPACAAVGASRAFSICRGLKQCFLQSKSDAPVKEGR